MTLGKHKTTLNLQKANGFHLLRPQSKDGAPWNVTSCASVYAASASSAIARADFAATRFSRTCELAVK